MVNEEGERLGLISVFKPINTHVSYDICHVTSVLYGINTPLVIRRNEEWVIVISLAGEHIPVIKALRNAFKMQFTYKSCLVTIGSKDFRHRLLVLIELMCMLVVGLTIHVAVLAREHTSTART